MEGKRRHAVLSGFSVGFIFGFALEKTKVYLPQVIRAQMTMTSHPMMKVFFMATSVGLIAVNVGERLGLLSRGPFKSTSLGFNIMKRHGGNIVGGLLLGIGMTISGSCPGTVMSQLGVGIWSAKYTVAGALLAAMSMGYIQKIGSRTIGNDFLAKHDSKAVMQGVVNSNVAVAIGASAIFGGLALAVEKYSPFTTELASVVREPLDVGEFLVDPRANVWPPLVGGAVIGLLQIPSHFFSNHFLGASSCYVLVSSKILSIFDSNLFANLPYYKNFQGFAEHAQLGSNIGIIVGSFLSALLSRETVIQDYSHSPLTYFIGGYILLLGARIGGGCTSGHLSGFTRLSMASLVSIMSMFAGGMLTAAILPL